MSTDNDEQREFWDRFSTVWVNQQNDLDGLMANVLSGVLDRAALKPGQTVLDVGCGTGTSSLLAAAAVEPKGHVLGVDISEPMLRRARANAKNVSNVAFETADAAEAALGDGRFDAVISRFGVMFFADPAKAFRNICRSMKSGAQITMATWSVLDANPWFQVPMYAAKRRLGAPPPMDPDGPGPLAFRDIDRVCGILTTAGFESARGEPVSLDLTPPGDMLTVARHATSIGPAARAMEYFEGSETDLIAIAKDVAESFAPYDTEEGARIPARINFFVATAP